VACATPNPAGGLILTLPAWGERVAQELVGTEAKKVYPSSVELEWDSSKALQNLRKHGVSFSEAATALGDPLSETAHDPAHSEDEDRYLTVGRSAQRRLLLVAHTERGNRFRIISARELTRAERKAYEER
jgi:uncharacterized DUF497 family protein